MQSRCMEGRGAEPEKMAEVIPLTKTNVRDIVAEDL